jgi:hypothetical protein
VETVDPGGPRQNWRIQTSYGPVYLALTRGLIPDWPDETFTTVWPLSPHLAEARPRGWTVWRQDDNGNRYEMSGHDTRAEADSVAASMEARGHKQTYWVASPE